MVRNMLNQDLIKRVDLRHPATWLATWFGAGFAAKAPGTFGTLAALPFAILIFMFFGMSGMIVAAALTLIIGLWAARHFETMSGDHDNGAIVIDEAAGLFVAFVTLPILSPFYILVAFALFRFFDILKPWPISMIDKKMPGAWGVMLDDIMAGLYAAMVIMGVSVVMGNV